MGGKRSRHRVRARKPKPQTVTRWRAVFRDLNEHFHGRDIAHYTDDEVRAWKNALVTGTRSARVVNTIWLASCRTVFGWAAEERLIGRNPFTGVRVAGARKAEEKRLARGYG